MNLTQGTFLKRERENKVLVEWGKGIKTSVFLFSPKGELRACVGFWECSEILTEEERRENGERSPWVAGGADSEG